MQLLCTFAKPREREDQYLRHLLAGIGFRMLGAVLPQARRWRLLGPAFAGISAVRGIRFNPADGRAWVTQKTPHRSGMRRPLPSFQAESSRHSKHCAESAPPPAIPCRGPGQNATDLQFYTELHIGRCNWEWE
jgi:hypothetical protein